MIKCDRCEAHINPIAPGDHHTFYFDIWKAGTDRHGPHPPGDLCRACALFVGERLTEFARGLRLAHESPFGSDRRMYAISDIGERVSRGSRPVGIDDDLICGIDGTKCPGDKPR